jgi:hypothetical protein
MTAVSQVDEGPFSELMALIRDSSSFLQRLVKYLRVLGKRDEAFVAALEGFETLVVDRSTALLAEIASGRADDDLTAHGLANDSPDWRFKNSLYKLSRADFEKSAELTSGRFQPLRKLMHVAKSPLHCLNVVLRSVTSAMPGVGGAYGELKDGAEAAVDLAVAQPGVFRRVGSGIRRVGTRIFRRGGRTPEYA